MKRFRTGDMFLLIFIVLCITGCSESIKRSEDQHTNQTTTQKVQAENLVNNYLTAVSEKKIDEAYQMLDATNLPNKENFSNSINSVKISDFSITKSQKIDDANYKFFVNYTQNGSIYENVPFSTRLTGYKWYIVLAKPEDAEIIPPKESKTP
ncbi:hypothetical protein [Paenibacillus planticolens]|uniref:Lipoprotein n=1 Tax=Paenibacillus planticolens TaxID=2654976 RepID=A0ABX2A1B4_9BACL|nr:hypothetical protein [Paenibacillus planticolens]NOV04788.1 hypothetical protein [Paenibacillus planticolens]